MAEIAAAYAKSTATYDIHQLILSNATIICRDRAQKYRDWTQCLRVMVYQAPKGSDDESSDESSDQFSDDDLYVARLVWCDTQNAAAVEKIEDAMGTGSTVEAALLELLEYTAGLLRVLKPWASRPLLREGEGDSSPSPRGENDRSAGGRSGMRGRAAERSTKWLAAAKKLIRR